MGNQYSFEILKLMLWNRQNSAYSFTNYTFPYLKEIPKQNRNTLKNRMIFAEKPCKHDYFNLI
mgnify:CR=1 FL=1